jgi:hypothetical protein
MVLVESSNLSTIPKLGESEASKLERVEDLRDRAQQWSKEAGVDSWWRNKGRVQSDHQLRLALLRPPQNEVAKGAPAECPATIDGASIPK